MFAGASQITRGRLISIDDSGEHQRLTFTGYAGEKLSDVVRAQPHGFTSHPPANAVGYMLRMGESDRVLALGFETPNRPRSVPVGTAALYDSSGNVIFAKAGEGIKLRAEAGGLTIETPQGSISVADGTGDMTITRGPMKILMSATRIDLGGPGGQAVQTVGGPSSIVFARVSL
jgi:phage gp45-like